MKPDAYSAIIPRLLLHLSHLPGTLTAQAKHLGSLFIVFFLFHPPYKLGSNPVAFTFKTHLISDHFSELSLVWENS